MSNIARHGTDRRISLEIPKGKFQFDSIEIKTDFDEGLAKHPNEKSSVTFKRKLHYPTEFTHNRFGPEGLIYSDNIKNINSKSKRKLLNTLRLGLNQVFKAVFNTEPFRRINGFFEPLSTSLDLCFRIKPPESEEEQKFELQLSSEGNVRLKKGSPYGGSPKGIYNKDKKRVAKLVKDSITATIAVYNRQYATNTRRKKEAA